MFDQDTMKNDIMGGVEDRYQRSVDAQTLDDLKQQSPPLPSLCVLALSSPAHLCNSNIVRWYAERALGREMKGGGGKGERRRGWPRGERERD